MGLPILAIAGLLIFAGASYFFALAESAIFALGNWQVKQLAEKTPKSRDLLNKLFSEPEDLLAAIVFGNTLANGSMIAIVLWSVKQEQWLMSITLAALLLVILVVGEVIPKTLAVRMPEQWVLRIAKPMLFMQGITRPIRKAASRINSAILLAVVPKSVKPHGLMSDEEYQELLELAYQQGTLAHTEKEIILQIIGLDRKTAKDVMKVRSQMASISDDLSVEEMVEAARKYKHSRLPMYDETPDTIVGVLNARALLMNPEIDLADAIEFPSFVPASMNLLQLLKSLQRQQRGLAIVLDEFGGTAGIVTLEDILEEMVGKIHKEGFVEGFVMEKLGEGRWRVNGTMLLEDLRREYPALGEVSEADTVGGLVLMLKEVVPAVGETVSFRGLRFRVQNADERRIREVLVEVAKK